MLDGISHMDLVYQRAVLTIIAAHGRSADAGLPGLHPGTRTVEQKIIEVLPGIKMTHTGVVYDAMSGSYYNRRGWTLQELLLSHRALVFTEHRIYFRCRANCWSEDTIYDNFPTAINDNLHSGTGISVLDDDETKPLQACYSQLFRYTSRELTKESDRIHGFTGILRFLSARAKSGVLEGLFTSSFDISLLFWTDWRTETDTTERQEGFPSWSWAGWSGISSGYGRACNSAEDTNTWLQKMTYIVWYKHSPKSPKLDLVWDLQAQVEHGKPGEHHIGYRSTLDNPYGRTTSLKHLKTRPDDDDIDSHRAGIIHNEMEKCKYSFLQFFAHVISVPRFGYRGTNPILKKILGPSGIICGWIQFHDPTLMHDVQGPHELVLLSEMGPSEVANLANMDKYDQFFNRSVSFDRPFYWVMLIVWVGEEKVVAERRGVGFIYKDRMRHLPEKVWTEIVLA
ncbi:hypothetical protein BDN70DRAFT_58032 [Pholiota conissans]|uniref:Heterokaryon incompatibility domain-containing protein n=1 Tax=Pholiota conissans TaxID=109636 RepID=A0A9P5ZB73_9AGAR|nr:hypothetical protein BDN70DRAFT_58032 [Pholiota conissans]